MVKPALATMLVSAAARLLSRFGSAVVAVASAYLINCRSLRRSIFSIGWFSNPRLWLGIGLTALLQLLFTYAPMMNRFLHTAPIDLLAWLRILGVALAALVIVEVEKKVRSASKS